MGSRLTRTTTATSRLWRPTTTSASGAGALPSPLHPSSCFSRAASLQALRPQSQLKVPAETPFNRSGSSDTDDREMELLDDDTKAEIRAYGKLFRHRKTKEAVSARALPAGQMNLECCDLCPGPLCSWWARDSPATALFFPCAHAAHRRVLQQAHLQRRRRAGLVRCGGAPAHEVRVRARAVIAHLVLTAAAV